MNGGLVIVETDTYNFGNEVTSVSLPTWSQQIGYNYDASGRLQTVTASGFNTWTYNWQTQQTTYYPLANFATDITHRASGALKHLTYGNAAELNLQYNERQLPSTSQLTNVVDDSQTTFPRTFDYYPDGRVHHAYDPNRNIFDRAYDYDHAGRLKEAYSGSQARGGTTNDGPYRQSYGYNAFGNQSQRTNYLWGNPITGDAASYTNNRRADYLYDDAGNITWDGNEHTMDAAGQQSGSKVLDIGALTTVYITQTYDGDGRPAKRTEHRVIEQENGPTQEQWLNNYFLTSSVLGGAAIVDLDGAGYKEKLRVFAGGTILAEEGQLIEGQLISGGVQWRHNNPATNSWTEIRTGGLASRQEMDPLSADVTTNPWGFPQPNYLLLKDNGQRLYDEGDDPFNVGSGCSLDGVPVSCSYLGMRMDEGSVQTQYLGRYERGPNSKPGDPFNVVPITKDVKSFGLGIYEIWMPSEFRGNDGPPGGWVLYASPSVPEKPAPGSFQDCFQKSGLATTHVQGQYADATHFTQDTANLLLDIHSAEGTSLSLLGVTLMNENTFFDLKLGPNTKFKNIEWWDVGPFQLNQHYTNIAIKKGAVTMDGLDYGGIYGVKVRANEQFYGDPLQNGRMAGRLLNAAGGSTNRQRAINYAQREGRGNSYDSFAPLFDRFFDCFKR